MTQHKFISGSEFDLDASIKVRCPHGDAHLMNPRVPVRKPHVFTTTFLDDNLDKVFYDKMDLDTFIDKANETIAEDFADGYVFAG